MYVTFHTGLYSGVDVRWRHDKIYFENHIFLPTVRTRSGSAEREHKQ